MFLLKGGVLEGARILQAMRDGGEGKQAIIEWGLESGHLEWGGGGGRWREREWEEGLAA